MYLNVTNIQMDRQTDNISIAIMCFDYLHCIKEEPSQPIMMQKVKNIFYS